MMDGVLFSVLVLLTILITTGSLIAIGILYCDSTGISDRLKLSNNWNILSYYIIGCLSPILIFIKMFKNILKIRIKYFDLKEFYNLLKESI